MHKNEEFGIGIREGVSIRVGKITVGSIHWGQLKATLLENMATALCLTLAHATLVLATPSAVFWNLSFFSSFCS